MNPADNSYRTLPRYGVGDNDKTRSGVVLFDWNDDDGDEPTVRLSPVELGATVPLPPPPEDIEEFEEVDDIEILDDDIDMDPFPPRWRGVGRRPGAVALAVVLGISFTIGAFALLGSSDAQAHGADAGTTRSPSLDQ